MASVDGYDVNAPRDTGPGFPRARPGSARVLVMAAKFPGGEAIRGQRHGRLSIAASRAVRLPVGHLAGQVRWIERTKGGCMRLYGRILAVVAALGVALLPSVANAGTGWVIQPTPDPSGHSGEGDFQQLEAVSCSTATSCTAVGDYFDNNTGMSATLAVHWDGTSWQIQPTANPSTTPGVVDSVELRGVKCVSASACIAVGQYVNPAASDKRLLKAGMELRGVLCRLRILRGQRPAS
jgi:hypothetical protein